MVKRPRCPELRGTPYSVDRCKLDGSVCLLELNKPCDLWEVILKEWKKKQEVEAEKKD